ncbi:MAG: carboxypeptidase regulatory-like domain-containing protein [Bacteroidetes bacterium]|nr:carboxypeptidase regulatory-like domain-containing protein [Bacteroidota bacterium]
MKKNLLLIPGFTFFIPFIFIYFFSFSELKAQDERDSLVGDDQFYLELNGRVLESRGQEKDEDKKNLDSAEVTVTNESGKKVLYGLTDKQGRLSFRLPFSRKFVVHITKKGYVEKMIEVDTHVPVDEKKNYTFAFNVDIFESIQGLDVSILSKPIAKVKYHTTEKIFSYDVGYTSMVNGSLQKMYRDYYALKRKEKTTTDSATSASDSLKRPVPGKVVSKKTPKKEGK